MPFHPGQLVVCVVDSDGWDDSNGVITDTLPEKGKVYTVRDFGVSDGQDFIRLEEIHNAPCPHEVAFDVRAFRPVDDSKLTIFREALTKTPTPALADA